ncbi:MAG: sodium:solute symporter family protein [Pirellulales bacterium]|nr:sodium:solute symporter family protein [Pirellulales bacterium]
MGQSMAPGLTWADFVGLAFYAALMISVGYYSLRKIHNTEDFFIGGRSFGKFFTLFAQYGESVNADAPIMTADQTFRQGLSGVWISLTNLFALPVYWIYFLWLRRFRYVTISDLLQARYRSKPLTALHSVFSLFCLATWISVGFTAMGDSITKIVSVQMSLSAAQGDLVFSLCILATMLLVLSYGVCGGVHAAILTDCIQSIWVIFFTIVLVIPIALAEGGGLAHIRQVVPHHLLDVFGGEGGTYTWYYVLCLLLAMLAGHPAWPSNMLTNVAKDERTAQIGVVFGFLLKRTSVVAWGVVGLLGVLFFNPTTIAKGQVYGALMLRLLAPIGLGLVGLVIAGLMSALMSTASAHMVAAAATFTENVYRPLFAPGRSDRHYMFIGRIASLVFLLVTAVVAYSMRNMVDQFLLSFEGLALFGPVFWLGFVWRRATVTGAAATVLGGLLLVFVLPMLACLTPLAEKPEFLGSTPAVRVEYPGQIATQYDVDEGRASKVGEAFTLVRTSETTPIFFTDLAENADGRLRGAGRIRPEILLLHLAGVRVDGFGTAAVKSLHMLFPALLPFVLMYGCSLLSRQTVPKRNLDDFYARMLTPAMGKPPHEDARQVAENAAHFDQRMRGRHLFPDSNWVIERFDRYTVVGFFVVCLMSLGVLGILWLIGYCLR